MVIVQGQVDSHGELYCRDWDVEIGGCMITDMCIPGCYNRPKDTLIVKKEILRHFSLLSGFPRANTMMYSIYLPLSPSRFEKNSSILAQGLNTSS